MMPEILQIVKERVQSSKRGRRWNRLRKLGPTATVSTLHGPMTIDTRDDVIGRILFEQGGLEFDLIERATASLREGGKLADKGVGGVLDIGGNIGHTTLAMLKGGQFAFSVVFEPDPNNFALLRMNVDQNKMTSRVTAFQLALSDQEGELEFELSDQNFGDHRVRVRTDGILRQNYQESNRRVISIKSRRLDSVLSEMDPAKVREIGLVWIDVQGHERQVFAGATRILEAGIPIVAEFWPYGLARAGTTCGDYCQLIERYYRECWVERGGRFVRYPISVLRGVWDEFAPEREGDARGTGPKEATLIFTR